jgi:hypothetical protein
MAARTPVAVAIVRAPIGEAPDWVREAWIGLRLPIGHPAHAVRVRGVGVLSVPRSRLGWWWAAITGRAQTIEGYLVPSAEAIALLADHRPEAAAWWRSNTPWFSCPGQQFLFDTPACAPIYADETGAAALS